MGKNRNIHYVYVVRCADGTLYTGYTTDAVRRVREHNGELFGGAKYTKVRRPVELLITVPHPTRSLAQQFEAQFKKKTRAEKLAYVMLAKQANPAQHPH